jgi:hypothetical protein
VVALFRVVPLDNRATSLDDGANTFFCLAPLDGHALEVLPFFRLHPSSTPHQFYPPGFFLVIGFITFENGGVGQLQIPKKKSQLNPHPM